MFVHLRAFIFQYYEKPTRLFHADATGSPRGVFTLAATNERNLHFGDATGLSRGVFTLSFKRANLTLKIS
jgi:hypothetical protein